MVYKDEKIINAIKISALNGKGDNEFEQSLIGYDPNMSAQEFKERYTGFYQKDTGKRLSKSSMMRLWKKFVKEERISFFKVHNTFTIEDILAIGIDKFVYTMGWTKPSHVKSWRNNKVRVGVCCHCRKQFMPLIFQTNHGLCNHCRPLYSVKAMKNFVLRELHTSERYHEAHRDMLMDFYIMFYHDANLRKLFLKGSEWAEGLERLDVEIPEWVKNEQEYRMKQLQERVANNNVIDAEFTEVEEDGREN